ncbi:hypothetical protein [Maribacter sp. 2307UL18-2]|uniref:hypothetical protein n=1 Tax=Maribacter sp. 2307UL18-2 TaxID=3386274 RepID=UPI0039BD2F6D
MKISLKFIPILVVFSISSSGVGQNIEKHPLSDAINYVRALNPNKEEYPKAYFILKKYDSDESVTFLNENRISGPSNTIIPVLGLLDSIPDFDKRIEEYKLTESPGTVQGAGAAPSIAAPLIDALSTVVAKRFKEELTLAFLEDFKDKLKKQKYLAQIFPNAYNVLLNENIFNTSLWLTTFRGAMDEDLKILPENVPVVLEAIKNSVNLKGDTKKLLSHALSLYRPALQFINHPEKSYANIQELTDAIVPLIEGNLGEENSVKGILLFSRLFLKELGDKQYSNWSSKQAISQLLRNPQMMQAYIGFTLEKYKDKLSTTSFNETQNVYDAINTGGLISKITTYLTSAVQKVNGFIVEVETLNQRRRSEKIGFSDYLDLTDKGFGIIEFLANDDWINSFFQNKESNSLLNSVSQISQIISLGNSIKTAVDAKEYSKILVSLFGFIKTFIPQEALDASKTFPVIVNYANLAIGLSGAKTSEEMVAVIETAALPLQSYRLKRYSRFSISLNAYAGAFFGYERLQSANVANKTSALIGFTAPIGVGFNWALGTPDEQTGQVPFKSTERTDKKGTSIREDRYLGKHSLSVFASLIDVGALAVYRLSDDQTPVGDIQFQNIFAPGAQVIFGWGKTPISIGLGVQYGPSLRKVNAVDGFVSPTIESRGWRYGASLIVDIPLLQLYRK